MKRFGAICLLVSGLTVLSPKTVFSAGIVEIAQNAIPSTGAIHSYIVSPEDYHLALRVISSLVARAADGERRAIESGSKLDKRIQEAAKDFLGMLPINNLRRGSAWVWNEELGLVMTNHHVVAGGLHFRMKFANGTTASLTLVASDPLTDVALLRVTEKDGPLPSALQLDLSCETPEGEEVVSIGYPSNPPETKSQDIPWALSYGRLMKAPVRYDVFLDVLQLDNRIIPGFSGGPALSQSCGVIGMNVMHDPSSIIPISIVDRVARDLLSAGRVKRGFMGVNVGSVYELLESGWFMKEGLDPRDFPEKGILVEKVVEDSPAARAGIERGDVILAVGGKEVIYVFDFIHRISRLLPGTTVVLRVWRKDREEMFGVVLTERSK